MRTLPGQLTLPDPLDFTLRQAWEQFHRQPDHSRGHTMQLRAALAHWERCTGNPAISRIDNSVMHGFRCRFLSEPLPTKVARWWGRCRREEPAALRWLSALALQPGDLSSLPEADRYAKVRERCATIDALPSAMRRSLLASNNSFNSVRAGIEGILSTIGPKTDRRPFALGLLPSVPRCRPATADEPIVICATQDEVDRIYRAADVAAWPSAAGTGLPPAAVWRALLVYLWNCASRREDFLELRKEQVHFEGDDLGLVTFRHHKTGKVRALPLTGVVVSHLRAIWTGPGELVFPFPKNSGLLYDTWRLIQLAAGIKVARQAGSDRYEVYGFHEIRKTGLSEYFALSEVASQMLGAHSSLQLQLRHYIAARHQAGVLRQAAEQLPQPSAFLGADNSPPPPPRGDRPRLRVVG